MPPLADRFGMSYKFAFRGILGNGEMILTPITTPNPFFFLCYNPEVGEFRKIVIDDIVHYSDDTIQVFFDHAESYMVL
ncbi:BnaA01g33450D [Brassica napus]|uniref:BnaA01g33450D protein n=2 Tax=Brassica TaxID=3705 RepID=A0A078G6T2_BRANA|nr:BnaA01g33450D [Brassica napus]